MSKLTLNQRIRQIHIRLVAEFRTHAAPVIDLITAQTHDPYRILVGTLLSARTKDAATARACEALFSKAPDLAALLTLTVDEIDRLIQPVGFHQTKAKHIYDLARLLVERHAGNVPDTLGELTALPGVGLKTANLVLANAFHIPAICVDTHVHRLANLWFGINTPTPEKTEAVLRSILPKPYWLTWNAIVVAHGQTICRPPHPSCDQCPLGGLCPRHPDQSMPVLEDSPIVTTIEELITPSRFKG